MKISGISNKNLNRQTQSFFHAGYLFPIAKLHFSFGRRSVEGIASNVPESLIISLKDDLEDPHLLLPNAYPRPKLGKNSNVSLECISTSNIQQTWHESLTYETVQSNLLVLEQSLLKSILLHVYRCSGTLLRLITYIEEGFSRYGEDIWHRHIAAQYQYKLFQRAGLRF